MIPLPFDPARAPHARPAQVSYKGTAAAWQGPVLLGLVAPGPAACESQRGLLRYYLQKMNGASL